MNVARRVDRSHSLRQKESQAFACAAGLQELGHWQRMRLPAALREGSGEFGAAFGENDLFVEDDCVAGELHRLLGRDFDPISNVLGDGALAVFIKGAREPDNAAIGQRAKASVQMVEAVLDQFERDGQAIQFFTDPLVRSNV